MESRTERRLVTCLFIDAVGSTEATLRLGPERMQRLLAEAFAAMGATITEHGGTIEKYVGDAIFALFGAPVAHVDDPERALRAAEACAAWSASPDASGPRLAIRVGIESGEALVDLDALARGQRMAVGACVTIAARLQQVAEPGEILIGPTCHEATADSAEFESLGTLSLKGLGEIDGWRFLAFRTDARAREVAFVGRNAELEVLSHAFDRARGGRSTLALVLGPPGQGKSRLAAEATWRAGGGGALRVIEARCRPGAESGLNTPLRQLLQADVPDATAEIVRARLVALLGDEEGNRAGEAIAHSAGLSPSDRLLAISRFEQREVIAGAWRRYLAALGAEQPVVALVEDIHWADPVLLRVIDHATSDLDARLLVLATARPEFAGSAHLRPFTRDKVLGNRAEWGAAAEPRDSWVQIDLQALDPDAAAELARAAGGPREATARAAGNPLFIIELARSRVAPGSVPLTVQAAIEARLDELQPAERDLLQRASVAGEAFDVRDAALLGDLEPAEAAGMLGRVAHLGFVAQVGSRYRYHHALIRDVAYGRLPVAQRMALHATYAQAGVEPDDVEAAAHHWWQSVDPADAPWVWEDTERLATMRRAAFRAHLAAGRRLEGRNSYEDAQEVYTRATALADDPTDLAQAETAVGRAQARQGRGDGSWEHRLRAIDLYRRAGSQVPAELYADMLEVATLNWGYFQHLPDDGDVLRLLDEGIHVARQTRDDVSLARLLMERAAFTGEVGGLDEVVGFVQSSDAIRFADPAHRVALVYLWNGRVADAVDLYRNVVERLVPAGAVINEPEAVVWYGLAAINAGDLATARQLAARILEESTRRSAHTRQHAFALQALVRFVRGDWDELTRPARELAELVDAHPDTGFCLLGAATAGYGAIADLHGDRSLPPELEAFVARLIPESALIQASALMVPRVMVGEVAALDAGLGAYAPGLRLVDRQRTWDPCDLMPAVALTMLERWDRLEPTLARLDEFARGGGRLAGATAAAVREEEAAARGGPPPRHAELSALGYHGVSELLRFRPPSGAPNANGAPK